jgi:hypothetical protein
MKKWRKMALLYITYKIVPSAGSISPIRCLIHEKGGKKVKVKQSRYRPGVAQRVPGS